MKGKILFTIASIIWIASLTVHILSIFQIDVGYYFPFVLALHILTLLIFIPVVIKINNNKEDKKKLNEIKSNSKHKTYKSSKVIMKNAPSWFIIYNVIMYNYIIFNFIIFIITGIINGSPDIKEGKYVLRKRSEIIRTITKEEYHIHKARELRGLSGHWILFAGVTVGVFYPPKKEDDLKVKKDS